MHCPFCQHDDTRVIDTRVVEEGMAIRRRRECAQCGERYNTYETAELKMPVMVKSNVLMMKFIGEDMVPAPKLKDIDLDVEAWNELYLDVLKDMRVMYQDCKLIHADYSEYNCKIFFLIEQSELLYIN